ncbi:MAG: flavodoxin-dependent (E)-4-hydroxy-3-methylbut-2-enyl-diphosphate synthase [Firmicutes bacterium]|nr:flavodoxin-dependent (E)-4-hydroxy-3-methylbut-2-enyl-diphosphate synthase [Bacillota bacterium]
MVDEHQTGNSIEGRPLTRTGTRRVRVGGLVLGGGEPVRVQSMLKTPAHDLAAIQDQTARLRAAGCEIVRLAVPDEAAARLLPEVVAEAGVPIVADIHFNHRLALASIEAGVAKVRINPGNLGGEKRLAQVAEAAGNSGTAIRVGVNAGSLEKDLLARYGATPAAMVESAVRWTRFLDRIGFDQLVLSVKASGVPETIEAYLRLAREVDCPLHLGITEAGTTVTGTIRSAVGIGSILASGVGDTIRVSLAGDPMDEVRVGYEILKALHLRERGPTIIACPSCGRCDIDLVGLATEVERRLSDLGTPLRIAVMGCEVNGPGEAREADIGIAGGKETGLIFRNGKVVAKVKEKELMNALLAELGLPNADSEPGPAGGAQDPA